VLGISLGITTVVALGVVTQSLKGSASEMITFGGASFMVAQDGAADLTFSLVTEEDWRAIEQRPDVARAEGVLMTFSRVGPNAFFASYGREPANIRTSNLNLVRGRVIAEGAPFEAMIGARAVGQQGVDIGDTLTIEHQDFTVVGVYDSGNLWEDGGAYLPLAALQTITGRAGFVTAVFVTEAPGYGRQDVADGIEARFSRLTAIMDVGDYSKVDQGIEMLDAANMAISVLAVGIGAIGVMNTMVMSVFERTREIGIFRAVGWSGRRILRMIISESIFLCLVAAVVGTALGVLATRLILVIDIVSNFLEPTYDPATFLRALIIAVGVALIGAIYPAVRAVRLTPMEALRYE
jgi:putative ABC transport system permease protein